jgi:hypothetical protein
MTGGKLNETAQRQQDDRKKRLAHALRSNMALRKKRARPDQELKQPPQSQSAEADSER